MLDYDAEADRYDETRGGRPRAQAAAAAIDRLIRGDAEAGVELDGVVLDVAGGTGIVSYALAGLGYRVVACDRSFGMLRHATGRLPGRVIRGDGTALPIRSGTVRAVVMIWVLHLVPDAAPFVEEAGRVLRSGGVLVATVDKSAATHLMSPDARPEAVDREARIALLAEKNGLAAAGSDTFVGYGQPGPPTYSLRSYIRR